MIAEVIPDRRTGGELSAFSYLVPENLEKEAKIGSVVTIPFGRQKIQGVVLNIKNQKSNIGTKYDLKEILSINMHFALPQIYLEIAEWISNYYLCSLGEAVGLFLPPIMKKPRLTAQVASCKLQVASKISLTDEQQEILEKLNLELSSKKKKPALLHGVTGSGKTEIYIKLAEEAILKGKQVIVLVPEIILTPQTVERFEKVFGERIALMHHNLSKSEKFNRFYDFYTGKKPIIVGPRSALLVPCPNLGLIIIDEEHEDSFKQEQNPRYHAVTLAEKIASKTNALLILGSATPRVETYFKAKSGAYDFFTLTNRYQKSSLPSSKVVDLKDEIRLGNLSPISEELALQIRKTLDQKSQILLFLNRRGTATFVSCRDCGHVMLCKNCSIPLVYHVTGQDHKLRCHHCDYEEIMPGSCPNCGSMKIKYFGTGIDRIEKEIRNDFPTARIAKVDSTTITTKHDYEIFYQKFKNHEVDIVIGTQMIAKGLDIPGVDLVGIVSADTGLHLPHYRASERSFQLLTQVSGRSGRREKIGQTVIQTYWPESNPILFASEHDFTGFYENEILERKRHGYPPFKSLVRIIADHTVNEKALESISKIVPILTKHNLEFIGPGACFYQMLRGKYRYHIILKLDKLPDDRVTQIWRDYPHLVWDVEPTNLL